MKQNDDKVRCNLCENTFARFSPFGFPMRQNVLCPNCYSLESTRLLWFYLKNEVLGKKNKNNFLYFAPEKSILKQLQTANISLTTCENKYLDKLQPLNVEDRLAGGKFDVIIFSHGLQYVKNEQLVFDELKRLLRPGGFVLILTIINWEMERTYEHLITEEDKDRLKQYLEPGVERIYGADFKKHLIKGGFHVDVIDYAEELGTEARNYYRLGDGSREMIFKCKKI